jgi:hypothetical protein
MAHRYHDPRFLFTTVLLLWLNAGRALVQLAGGLLRRAPRGVRVLASAGIPALIVVLAWRSPMPDARAWIVRDELRSPATMLEPVDAVLDVAAAQSGAVAFLGTSNALSPALLAWRARQRGLPFSRSMPPPRAAVPAIGATPEAIAAQAETRMNSGALSIIALPVPGTPVYDVTHVEVWGDSAVAGRLRVDARLQARFDSTFSAGVRVEAYGRP